MSWSMISIKISTTLGLHLVYFTEKEKIVPLEKFRAMLESVGKAPTFLKPRILDSSTLVVRCY